jgi:transposase InsO family protein
MKEKSIGGARYYLLFKDDSTGYRYVYFLKQKSEVFTYFKQMVKELERDIGNKLKKFRSDRGGEFYSKAFDTYLLDNLIKRETSAAATP